MSNFYEILQVDKTASASEIKSSYKKLALKYHPDKCKPEEREQNEIEFKKITNAYETLSDEQKRREYDLQQSGDFFPGFGNFFNIFEQQEQMYNITVHISLTMEEVYTGVVKNVAYSKHEKCVDCNCKGYINPQDMTSCSLCNGTGFQDQIIQMGFMRQILKSQCNNCKGKGSIITKPCSTCTGHKYVSKEASVNLKFPRGIKNGDSVTLKNKGNYYSQTNYTTDLIVIAQILPHELYIRESQQDLSTVLHITLSEALKGFSKTIKFLDNSNLDIVSDSIVNPSSVITIPNKGIKNGMLFVRFNIEFPKDLSTFLSEINN
jgi:DnaJ-class molecular chaperone